MAEKGIIFSAPMVRALLDGRKTQTRRLLKPAPPSWVYPDDRPGFSCLTPKGHIEFRGKYVDADGVDHGAASKFIKLPYLKGDRLYVREGWRVGYGHDWYREDLGRPPKPSEYDPETTPVEYLADNVRNLGGRSWPSIFLPRWASRIWLAVTDVRVQRLQECSEADALAEGMTFPHAMVWGSDPLEAYQSLWNTLHTAEGERWDDNPWIVAVTFDVHHGNIDAVAS